MTFFAIPDTNYFMLSVINANPKSMMEVDNE